MQSPEESGKTPQPANVFLALLGRLKEHPLARLGPGLITGVADDDPSGIATYSQAGAQFGLNMLWTMPLAYPLMAAIQIMCAQIGRATGRGLAANIKSTFPPIVLKGVVLLLLIANTLNIAADVAAMGEVAELVSGFDRHLMTAVLSSQRYCFRSLCRITATSFSEMVDAFSAGLCRRFVHRRGSLGGSGVENGVAEADAEFQRSRHGRWHLRYDDQSISLFLAGLGRSGRHERQAQRFIFAKSRRCTFRAPTHPVGYLERNALFGPYGLFHYPGDRSHAQRVPELPTSKPQPRRRARSGHWPAILPFSCLRLGILGVGLIGVPVLAGSAAYALSEAMGWQSGLGTKSDGRARILRRDCRQRTCRIADSIFADQSDEGAVLERGNQRRGGGPADGRDHPDRIEEVGDGRVHVKPAHYCPELDRDGNHGAGRSSDACSGPLNISSDFGHPAPRAGQDEIGGAGGIRTLDRPLQAYNGLANRRLQPLGHSSIEADMPDTGPSRKPQIAGRPIRCGKLAHPLATPIKACVPFVQHLPETSARMLRDRRLLIACAGSFSNSPNRDGGGLPRSSVLGGSQEFPLLRGRGEGAKKLSSVPGGHILGGMGEPAQLFRPLSNGLSQHPCDIII